LTRFLDLELPEPQIFSVDIEPDNLLITSVFREAASSSGLEWLYPRLIILN
jgi:hypothetical protein